MSNRQVDGIAPTFEKKPSIRQDDDGRPLYFECFIIVESKPEVTWTHNGSHIVQKGRFKNTLEKKDKGYHSVMQVNEVNVEDAGKYKVIAKKELGESNAATTLNFDNDEALPPIDGAKPTFTENPVIKKSDDCSRITSECRLMADPNPTIQWYLNNKIVKEDSRHKFSLLSDKHNQSASLSITDVANGDGGNYRCNAVNQLGESNANIALNFQSNNMEEEEEEEELHSKTKRTKKEKTTFEETNETRVEQTEVEKTKTKKDSLMKNAENKESMAIKKTRKEMAEEKSVIIESSKEMDENISIKEESIEKSVDIKKSAEEMNKESVAVKKSTKEEEFITFKNTVEDKHKQSIIKKDVTEKKRKDSLVIEEPKKKLSIKKSVKRESIPKVEEPPAVTGATQPAPGAGPKKDEKGLAVDESGQTRKLRPGEILEVRRGSSVLRKGSIDLRRSSATEVDVADKPSSVLKTIGDEGPPVITDFIGSVSAVDGKTAKLQATVESNPVCSFKFFKEGTEIFEGGRYKVVTDGDTNNIYFCIRRAKPNDEGMYTITAINKFGEDSCNIKLFVSDDSGMDFRAMLKAKQYAKWKQEQDNPDWGNLKATEDERRASLKETKKPDVFIKPLQDQHVKEGRDKMVRFEAVYSKSGIKAKRFKGRTELFMGKKYNMNSTGDLHVLEIHEPRVDDAGQYKVQFLETSCTAMLEVDKPDPVYKFIKPLQKKYEEFTGRELVMECTTNHYKALVKWYKDESRLESGDRYLIGQNTFGDKILRITSCAVNDNGHYSCRIERTEEITKTEIMFTNKQYVFVKPLKSLRTTENETITPECEVDDMYAKVQWLKDGVELKAIPKRLEIISDGRKRKVIIKKAKVIDEGEYTCTTNSDKTICETTFELANKFRKKLQDKTVLEREDLVLEAEMFEKKAPIRWFKNGQEVKPDDRISFKFNEDDKQQLVITNAQLDDIGEYSVVSDKGIKCSCNVEVKEAEKKPELRLTQTDYQADANYPFSIEIPYKVQGTRTSNVLPKLMRNGEPVSTKDYIDYIVIKEDKIIITFKKPTRESSGPYDFSLGNSQGESKTPLKFNFVDVPSPPEGPLDVTDVFRDRCKLAWNQTKDTGGLPPLHYVVERQDLSMRGGWVEVGTTPDCNMDVTDLAHKKEYKFRVRAVNKKGASEPLTAPKTYLAKDPYDEPSKPKDVEIVDWDRDHVDLKWKAPEKDGGAPIEKYIVESKDKFSADWVTALEVSGNQLEGKVVPPAIKEGQQYQFRVRAINKAGPSEPSDPTKNLIVRARFVKPFIIGDDLKNLVVKKGAIIKYDIQYGVEPAPEVKWAINGVDIKQSSRISIENTPKNTLLLIKQAVRTDYGKFTLTLTNGSGTISKCADVVVLDKPTPPEGPLVVEAVFAESAKLKWKQPKDLGGSELKGYQIEKMDVDSGRWVPVGEVGPNANSFKCEGLTKGKKYKFRVKAINKEGESKPLETDEPTVAKNPYEEPSKPGKPEVVDYDNTKVDLKWTAPEKDGGRPVVCYIVEMKDKFSNDWKEVLRTPDAKPEVTVKGLKENSSVQFRVKAVNIAGPGEPSKATEPHVVKHRNQKPYIDRTNLKNITIKAGRSHKYNVDIRGEPPPTVVWTFSDDSIKLSDDLNIKIENIDYHSELTVSKATRKQSGKYKITATNRNGSDSVEVELTVLAAPSRPEGHLEVTDVHKEGCKLKWKKPKDDGGCPVKTYEMEKFDKKTGRWTRCGKTDKPEIDVTGLTPGKEYLFRVTAVNEEGDSEPLITLESIIAKNPYDEPTKPGTHEIVDYDNTSVELKWSPPKSDDGANIEKYIIEKKDKNAHNWEKAAEVIGNVCEAKEEDLKERSEVQFRVVAINKAGPSEPSDATKMHCVKHRSLKPYIDRTNLEMNTIKRSKQAKLDVNVRSEPPPAITWKLIDNEVKSDHNYDIVNVDYNTKFTLNDCQRKHSGKYKIIAVNEVGKDEAKVEINILDIPSKPEGPLDISDVHANGCTLEWNPPKDDGGLPLYGYFVEKLDTDSGVWVTVLKCREPQLEVSGLTPGKQYKFRVSAVNKEGMSEPLEATEAHAMVNKPIIDVNAVRDIIVKAGQDFCISVPFTASPKPTVSWAYNGKDIDSVDTHFMQKTTDNNAQLVSTNDHRGDIGKLMVTLKNYHGFDTITSDVTNFAVKKQGRDPETITNNYFVNPDHNQKDNRLNARRIPQLDGFEDDDSDDSVVILDPPETSTDNRGFNLHTNPADYNIQFKSNSNSPDKQTKRTRLTHYQIHVLQEFFKINAYPKGHDLEHLSKQLNLSSRVVMVWFNNNRRKARKLAEISKTRSQVIENNDARTQHHRSDINLTDSGTVIEINGERHAIITLAKNPDTNESFLVFRKVNGDHFAIKVEIVPNTDQAPDNQSISTSNSQGAEVTAEPTPAIVPTITSQEQSLTNSVPVLVQLIDSLQVTEKAEANETNETENKEVKEIETEEAVGYSRIISKVAKRGGLTPDQVAQLKYDLHIPCLRTKTVLEKKTDKFMGKLDIYHGVYTKIGESNDSPAIIQSTPQETGGGEDQDIEYNIHVQQLDDTTVLLSWDTILLYNKVKDTVFNVEIRDNTQRVWTYIDSCDDYMIGVPFLKHGRTYLFRITGEGKYGNKLEAISREYHLEVIPKRFTRKTDKIYPVVRQKTPTQRPFDYITDRPGQPFVRKLDDKYISLLWCIPGEIDVNPITEYIVQVKYQGQGGWSRANPHKIVDTFCNLPMLDTKTTVEFRVIAVTTDGRSKPSKSSGLINYTVLKDG